MQKIIENISNSIVTRGQTSTSTLALMAGYPLIRVTGVDQKNPVYEDHAPGTHDQINAILMNVTKQFPTDADNNRVIAAGTAKDIEVIQVRKGDFLRVKASGS